MHRTHLHKKVFAETNWHRSFRLHWRTARISSGSSSIWNSPHNLDQAWADLLPIWYRFPCPFSVKKFTKGNNTNNNTKPLAKVRHNFSTTEKNRWENYAWCGRVSKRERKMAAETIHENQKYFKFIIWVKTN